MFATIRDEKSPLDRRRGEVTDGHAHVLRARLGAKPRDHRLRQIDPVHAHTAPGKGQGDSAGADAELESGAVAREIRQERDHGVEDRRVGLVGVPLVEPPRDVLAEVVLGHRWHSRRAHAAEVERRPRN